MNTADAELVEIVRPAPIPGRIIAEFACALHAKLFAGLLREAGELVTITAGVNLMFAVRQVVSQ